MSQVTELRANLRALPPSGWEGFLAEHSGLPGPRANLSLLAAVIEECPARQAYRFCVSADEYEAMCGAATMGRLIAENSPKALGTMRTMASDGRWRIREAVAIGLQRIGDANLSQLREIVGDWAADDDPLVQRAAIAGICEPRLVKDPETARHAIAILDRVTASYERQPAERRRGDDVRALRQALGYCWGIAIAADVGAGFDAFEPWADSADADLHWIVRENLKKTRLHKADAARADGLHAKVSLR